MASLTSKDATDKRFSWKEWARDEQLPPKGDWKTWLFLAGRGAGKTWTGAHWVRDQVLKGKRRIALVGATAADVRDVVIEGDSGILAISPPDDYPRYEPSKRRLTWQCGAIATAYSADEPNRLRGPQHDAAFCDELAAWRYPDTWDQLMFGLRLGSNPQVVATTTPRPIKLIRELLADPTTAVTKSSTYANKANLAPTFFHYIMGKYEGTRLGRQEIHAELLDDLPGALWTREVIEKNRVGEAPELARIVIGVDPAATSSKSASQTGIVAAGTDGDGGFYVLADRTLRATPDGWGRAAIKALDDFDGDRIVAEVNQGGEMVESVLRTIDKGVPYKAVRASRGKVTRAEPVAALYEQGKVKHVGMHKDLEDQQCMFTTDGAFSTSPDRVDALVWAITELMKKSRKRAELVFDSSKGVQANPWKI